MKRIFAATWTIVILHAGTATAVAADYIIDLTHSHVLFMVDHLGFAKMVGLFTNFGGISVWIPKMSPLANWPLPSRRIACRHSLLRATKTSRALTGLTSPNFPR